MKISVFGLGYVGVVSAACFAKDGHEVFGVDTNMVKVDIINSGRSPIIEKEIDEILRSMVDSGKLRAMTDSVEAVRETDISLVCVGTPSQLNGNLDLKFIRTVCEDIGSVIRTKKSRHIVVIRSTILPGSMRSLVIPTLEEFSGKQAGKDFGVCNNPEFLREGTAVYDFFHPPKTVIGEMDAETGDIVSELYRNLDASLIRTNLESAEMVKYADNNWHALKVCFANEIGNICKRLGVDSHIVMDIFCQDKKLNLSSYYLKPGFAFGGSCLPKDVRALTYKGKSMDLELPILNSILTSNQCQKEHAIQMIKNAGNQRVSFLGMSFKAGTDDLRESPIVEVIEHLIGKGFDIRIYDRYVRVASLVGANRDYILNQIPHISGLMVDSLQHALDHGGTVVVGNEDEEFNDVLKQIHQGQVLIDLVRVSSDISENGRYDGICW